MKRGLSDKGHVRKNIQIPLKTCTMLTVNKQFVTSYAFIMTLKAAILQQIVFKGDFETNLVINFRTYTLASIYVQIYI